MKLFNHKQRIGPVILASAFLFYFATVFVRLGHDATNAHPLYFLAARFWLGYLVILLWKHRNLHRSEMAFEAINKKWLRRRALWNVIAVFCFYLGVIYGSVTGSNILNMTHPAFVAIFSSWLLHEMIGGRGWLGVALAISGAFLIIGGGGAVHFMPGDLFGLLSAITAGLALTALRKTRLTDSTNVIIWYVFRMGFWLTVFPIAYLYLFTQERLNLEASVYVLLSAICGILGQLALTYGFKYVSAVRGSILSSSRLVIALVFGWLFWQNEMNAAKIWGALSVLAANILLAQEKQNQAKKRA